MSTVPWVSFTNLLLPFSLSPSVLPFVYRYKKLFYFFIEVIGEHKNPDFSKIQYFQAGKESKLYNNDPGASRAHKILIPLVLLATAGAAAPLFLLNYKELAHTCTDPFRIMFVTETESPNFKFDLYSTVVTVFTYVFPVLIIPLSLPIATLRTCISRQCCVPRFKQSIGELIMTTIVCVVYLGTIVGVVLPRIDKLMELESVSED